MACLSVTSQETDMTKDRTRFILDADKFNKILQAANNCSNVVFCDYQDLRLAGKSLSTHSCLVEKQVHIFLTTQFYEWKKNKYLPTTYIFRKDGAEDIVMTGADAYQHMQRAYKSPTFVNDPVIKKYIPTNHKGSFAYSAPPKLYYNEKYDNTEHQVYIYDLNSAYGYQLLSDRFPDTTHYQLFTILHDNQVGFLFDNQLTMVTTPGIQCDIVFDTMESPYKKYVHDVYKMKKEGKTREERLRGKNLLNLPIGYQQRKNPFIRSFIVHSCNNFINLLIDDNTCMCNTDAIYSVVPRPELEIGTEIGQWKLEYNGLFRQRGMNYQKVEKDETCWRGIPKKWFPENYNILIDRPPIEGNVYRFNSTTLQVEERRFE